jgi:hypothetical protein
MWDVQTNSVGESSLIAENRGIAVPGETSSWQPRHEPRSRASSRR